MLCFTRRKQLHSTYIFFTGCSKSMNAFTLDVYFKNLEFSFKFGVCLKYTDLLCRPKIIVVSFTEFCTRRLKNFKTFYDYLRYTESPWNMGMSFNWANLYQIQKICHRIIHTYITRRYRSFTAITFALYLKPCELSWNFGTCLNI